MKNLFLVPLKVQVYSRQRKDKIEFGIFAITFKDLQGYFKSYT